MPKTSVQPLPAQQKEVAVVGKPIEAVRDAVRQNLARLENAFQRPEDQEELQCAADTLRASLRTLENEAGRHEEYEMLSRVAAIMHDVLKHNPITDFDQTRFGGFVLAMRQAIEGNPEQADPYLSEQAIYRAGVSWLPPMPPIEWPDDMEEEEEED
jgi:hypothetical protein